MHAVYQLLLLPMACLGSCGQSPFLLGCVCCCNSRHVQQFLIAFSMSLLTFMQYIDSHSSQHVFLFQHGCCVAGLMPAVILLFFYPLALFHILLQGHHGMSNMVYFVHFCLMSLHSSITLMFSFMSEIAQALFSWWFCLDSLSAM